MKRVLFGVAMLVTSACATEPAALAVADVNGEWVFTLTQTTQCTGAQGDIVATLEFSGDIPPVANTVSTWSNEPSDPDRYVLTGNVQLDTGETELRFWQELLVRGFMVTGTLGADGTFEGSAIDPIPGFDGYLSTDGCAYTVTGARES